MINVYKIEFEPIKARHVGDETRLVLLVASTEQSAADYVRDLCGGTVTSISNILRDVIVVPEINA